MATLQPIGLPFAIQDGVSFQVLDFNERYAVCSDGIVLARCARSKLSRIHSWDKWKVVKPWRIALGIYISGLTSEAIRCIALFYRRS